MNPIPDAAERAERFHAEEAACGFAPSRQKSFQYDVFMCHCGSDARTAEKLADRLRRGGLSVWLDEEHVRPGTSWASRVVAGIRQSRHFLVLVGEQGASPWWERDVSLFKTSRSRPEDHQIVVVLCPGGDASRIPEPFSALRYVDLRAWNRAVVRGLLSLLKEDSRMEGASRGQGTASRDRPGAAHALRDVFISHAEADGQVAIRIATHLEKRSWTTWYYERDSVPGPAHLEQTGRQIEKCRVMVVVLSRDSIQSEYVTNEVFRASEAGQHMIPVLVELTRDEILQGSPKWAMALGFSVSVRWDDHNADAVLERIAAGVSYFTDQGARRE